MTYFGDRIRPFARIAAFLLADFVFAIVSIFVAISLLQSVEAAIQLTIRFPWLFLLVAAVRIGTYQNYGLYSYLWRYASIKELLSIVKAVTIGSVLTAAFLFVTRLVIVPVDVLFIDWALTLLLIGMLRIGLRVLREHLKNRRPVSDSPAKNLIIVGAGDAGEMIAREILRVSKLNYRIVGFVDDGPNKVGQSIHNIPVVGTTNRLPDIVEQLGVEEAIIAIPSASGDQIRRIVSLLEPTGIKFKITPGLFEIIGRNISMNQLREVQIEDLLGRDVIETPIEKISHYIKNQNVLVTGAGGSIGSELCRQLILLSPKKLILLDHAENSVYQIDLELSELGHSHVDLIPVVADIKNRKRLTEVFSEHRPNVVFHAAAYKHVPLMEKNIREVVINNITGTQNVLELSDEFQVKECVVISTDKAVNSVNAMGASKRVGEILMQTIQKNSKTRFAAVRFGNVLGSVGSVVPLFKRQIAKGGPITITHPDMTRYFMTIPEASRLVIQAGSLSQGGEIFILDMGEPVKILDLAKDLIHLSGLEEGRDIAIQFVGVRPGEKLYEELYFSRNDLRPTEHQKIFISKHYEYNEDEIFKNINDLIVLAGGAQNDEIRRKLFEIVVQTQPHND